jgi:hypothetical protein
VSPWACADGFAGIAGGKEEVMAAVIGVYHDNTEPAAVARELVEHGIDPDEIRVGASEDHYLSIRAEMEAQVSDSWGTPGLAAFMTSEMMRGAVVFVALGSVIGAIVGIPIGLLLFFYGNSVWTQIWFGALVGVLFGSAVGAILGGGLAMQSPEDALAAESGITVRVEEDSPEIEVVMASHGPIRLDVFSGQRRLRTPVTEGPSGIAETFDEFRRNIADPHRQG